MGFPERLLGDDEHVVLLLRRHVKVLAAPVGLLLVLVATVGAVFLTVPDGQARPLVLGVVGVAAGVAFLRWVVWPYLVWRTRVYVVTTDRLFLREGVLGRSGRDIPLGRINDISFTNTLLERMLGCGTLTVESAGERGQIVLVDVPRVEQVQRTLYELTDASGAPQEPAPPRRGAGSGRRGWGGYDTAGYDTAGYDTAGYDTAGYDTAGYDTAEIETAGYETTGYGEDDTVDPGSGAGAPWRFGARRRRRGRG
jgi:membrane protein YdbS with pleckstrin-like domain